MTNIDEVLAKLNPKIAASFQRASDIRTDIMPTPSLGLNMAIGGLGYGRLSILYGNRGCGKTTFALQQVATEQKVREKSCLWLDVEKNFNPTWARDLGADVDSNMIVDNQTISIAGMADKVVQAILAGIDIVVVDSISQLLPQSYFEDNKDGKGQGELKELHQTGQIGTFSKNMGQAVNMINSVNQNTAVIFISQVRNNIGSYGASKGFQGGYALEHGASTILKFWRTPSEFIEKEVSYGDILLKKPVGAPVRWTIEKNRGPGGGQTGTYDLYFKGDVGIDLNSELLNYGVDLGIIKKGGAWYTLGDVKLQGGNNMVEYLKDNPEVAEKVYEEILEKAAK